MFINKLLKFWQVDLGLGFAGYLYTDKLSLNSCTIQKLFSILGNTFICFLAENYMTILTPPSGLYGADEAASTQLDFNLNFCKD